MPEGVRVALGDDAITVTGARGAVRVPLLAGITAQVGETSIVFTAKNHQKQTKSNWGTLRALVANAVRGVQTEFVKELKIEGVGFRAALEGSHLALSLGFSHPVRFPIPEGVRVSVEKNVVRVAGVDRFLVGETAAKIRAQKKPEPYKGKGIMYVGEVIRRKSGKKVAGS